MSSDGERSARSALSALNPSSRRILIGNGISSLGSGLTFTFLVVYLGQVVGLGTLAAGLIVAYMSALGLICTLGVGALVDRFGPRPVLMTGLIVTAIGVASLTRVHSVPTAVLAATVMSLGFASYWSPQAALYARVTPRERRQDVFGLQFMVLNLGLGLGGLISATIIDVARPSTFTLLYLVDAATFLLYVAVLIPMRGVGVGPGERSAEEAPNSAAGYRRLVRDRALIRLAFASVVLLTFGYGSLEVGLPTYATVVGGLSPSVVAIAYAVNTAVIVVLQLGVLRFIRGRSRTRLGLLVGLLWALAWVLIGVAIEFPPLISGSVICLGFGIFAVGESIWSPVAPAIVNDLAQDDVRGRYNAMIGWTWNVSGTLGPAFAAIMLGAGLGYWWIAIVVVGCIFGGLLIARVRGLLTAQQDGVAPTSSAS